MSIPDNTPPANGSTMPGRTTVRVEINPANCDVGTPVPNLSVGETAVEDAITRIQELIFDLEAGPPEGQALARLIRTMKKFKADQQVTSSYASTIGRDYGADVIIKHDDGRVSVLQVKTTSQARRPPTVENKEAGPGTLWFCEFVVGTLAPFGRVEEALFDYHADLESLRSRYSERKARWTMRARIVRAYFERVAASLIRLVALGKMYL